MSFDKKGEYSERLFFEYQIERILQVIFIIMIKFL